MHSVKVILKDRKLCRWAVSIRSQLGFVSSNPATSATDERIQSQYCSGLCRKHLLILEMNGNVLCLRCTQNPGFLIHRITATKRNNTCRNSAVQKKHFSSFGRHTRGQGLTVSSTSALKRAAEGMAQLLYLSGGWREDSWL